MSGFQSPQLLSDLYRDLRDRRLLPLALVLVVGIAVVPMALSSSPPSPAPPTAPPGAPVAKKSTAPAVRVVAADPGLRDYRRRLRGDFPKDPFVQQFTAPTGLAAAQLTPSGGSSSSTSTSSSSTGSTDATSGASESGSGAGSAPAGDVTTGSQPTGEAPTQTETKLVNYRVKIRTGQVGSELKVQDEVGPLGSLPGGSVDALAFIGVTMDSDLNPKRAFFLVSNNATVVGGDSACVVGSPCQVLTLKLDQYVDVTWTDGLTYRVRLLKFRRHVRDRPPAQLGDQTDVASSG